MYLYYSELNYLKNSLPLEFLGYLEENLTFYGIYTIGYYYIDDMIYKFLYKKINDEKNK